MADEPSIVELETFESTFAAQVAQRVLEAEGIPTLLRGKKKATRYDLLFDALGMNLGACTLFVPRELLEDAREVLSMAREAGSQIAEDPCDED
ncbi:MAG: DUF2007 domain-containing protein [Planctomycetes bacterium]|nr:DUF2007 domain-containing protein [Planctomycetota bacterium]